MTNTRIQSKQVDQSRIQKLPPLLINQLAAGEVVTRPASVVKELLENAIDAGANKIEIRLTQGGMGVIEISDNGTGIHPDDMEMAVTRHATSKVADVESLYGIHTLGFRGEALASIAAVSRLSLTSSHDNSGVGRCLTVVGVIEGQADIVPCVCQQGTRVTVKDLYFNVPARRGNLKNVATEYAHIEAVTRQIALAYADIDLTLYHEGKKRLTLTAQTDKSSQAQQQRLQQAVSISLPQNAYPLSVDLSGLIQPADQHLMKLASKANASIDGWIWLDDNLQANADLPKLIYTNGRLVKDVSISQQVRQAVNSLDIAYQSVGYALFFSLPSEWCNLNVHPSKQRINIHALTNINAHLYNAIRGLLQPVLVGIKQSVLTKAPSEAKQFQQAQSVTDMAKQNDNFTNHISMAKTVDNANNLNDGQLSKHYKNKSRVDGHAVASPSTIYQVNQVKNALKQYQLTIITENHKSKDKAEKLAKLICKKLAVSDTYDIKKYHKLDNSFKIEFFIDIEPNENSILKVIDLSNRIVNMWSLFYQRDKQEVSLFFQKSEVSCFEEVAFNTIHWASFEVVE